MCFLLADRLRAAVIVLTLGASAVAAADAPPAETGPAERFTAQIKEAQDRLRALQDYRDQLVTRAASVDVDAINAGFQREIAIAEKLLAAWQKGDEVQAKAVYQAALDFESQRGSRWDQRIELRSRQALQAVAVTEDAYENNLVRWAPGPELAVAVEAKKHLADAIGRQADATMPDLDPKRWYQLEDDVFEAQVDSEMADKRMGWVSANQRSLWDPVSSPGLTAATERLDENRRQQEALHRSFRKAQHAAEVVGRAETALFNERERQIVLARAAKERERALPPATVPASAPTTHDDGGAAGVQKE